MADNINLEARLKAVIFLPCAIAPFSLVGSCLLLLSIYRIKQTQQKKLKTYHRLLMGVSFFDILSSIALTLGPLPIPQETGFLGAHGNTGTCTTQGFLQTLGLASFAYSTSLMIQYVLVIRYKVTDTTLSTKAEPLLLHAIPLLFCGGVAISGLPLQVYNPAGPFSCWISSYPPRCESTTEIPCERGGTISTFFRDYLVVIPIIVWTFLSITLLLIITCTVLQRLHQRRRFQFQGSDTISRSAFSLNTQQVVTQSLLYGAVFVNTTVWRMTNTFFSWSSPAKYYDFFGKHYWITVLGVIFYPLQGFFNFIIFVRPRYLALRRRNAGYGRWQALKTAIWQPSPQSQTMTLSSQQQQQQQQSNHQSPPWWQPPGVISGEIMPVQEQAMNVVDSDEEVRLSSASFENGDIAGKNDENSTDCQIIDITATIKSTVGGSSKDNLTIGSFTNEQNGSDDGTDLAHTLATAAIEVSDESKASIELPTTTTVGESNEKSAPKEEETHENP